MSFGAKKWHHFICTEMDSKVYLQISGALAVKFEFAIAQLLHSRDLSDIMQSNYGEFLTNNLKLKIVLLVTGISRSSNTR